MKLTRETLIIAILILALFELYSLGRAHLGHSIPDEKRYIQSTKEMVESGDYITPRYHGKLRFQKPILFYWLVILSYKIFGIGIFGTRFPSITAALLNVILVYLIGRDLFGKKAGIFSALVLSTSEVYFMYSRFGTPDMTFLLFITASIYLFLRAYRGGIKGNFRYLYMYVPMGLAMLTKGPLGFIYPMFTICLFLIFKKEWSAFKEIKFPLGILLFAAVSAPWFIIMVLLHGGEYLENVWTMEIIKKVKYFSSGENANLAVHYLKTALYYIGMVFARYLPWSILLPASLVSIQSISSERTKKEWRFTPLEISKTQNEKAKSLTGFAFIATWFFAVFISLILIWSKESYYVLGLSIPLALFMGQYLSKLTERNDLTSSLLFKLPFVLAIIISFLAIFLWLLFIVYILDKPIFPFSLLMLAVPIFMLTAYLRKDKMLLPLSIFVASFAFFAYFTSFIMPTVGREPLLDISDKIKSVIKLGDSVGVASSEVSYHRLNAHLEEYEVVRVVPRSITDWNQQKGLIVDFLTPEEGRIFCVMTKGDYYEYLDEGLRNRLYIIDRFFVWKKFHKQDTEYFMNLLSFLLGGKRELLRELLKEEIYLISNRNT